MGRQGFEPRTPRSSAVCSPSLSYRPSAPQGDRAFICFSHGLCGNQSRPQCRTGSGRSHRIAGDSPQRGPRYESVRSTDTISWPAVRDAPLLAVAQLSEVLRVVHGDAHGARGECHEMTVRHSVSLGREQSAAGVHGRHHRVAALKSRAHARVLFDDVRELDAPLRGQSQCPSESPHDAHRLTSQRTARSRCRSSPLSSQRSPNSFWRSMTAYPKACASFIACCPISLASMRAVTSRDSITGGAEYLPLVPQRPCRGYTNSACDSSFPLSVRPRMSTSGR